MMGKRHFFTTFSDKDYTSETFWWGVRATYTDKQTKEAVASARRAVEDITFIAAAIVWIPSMAGVTFLTAAYFGKLASSMEAKNKGKGVILDMTWVMAYSVKSR